MDKIFKALDSFILDLGKLVTNRPRLSALFILFIILIAISGWIMAAHYHRLAQLLLIPNEAAVETTTTAPTPVTSASPQNAATTPTATNQTTINATLPQPANGTWQTVTVKRGDNLQRIFKRLHLTRKELAQIMALGEAAKPLAKLKPRQQLRLLISDDQQLLEIQFPIDQQNTLTVVKSATGFAINANQKPLQQALTETISQTVPTSFPISSSQFGNAKFGFAVIKKSLYQTGIEAGLSRKQVLELVHLFTLNANVIKKIRPGDQLSVVYQPDLAGTPGYVLAAELMLKDKPYQIFRYTDPKGNTDYYTADGTNLHPPIIRAPLVYTHISSGFSAHRWQPILHFFRPHYGVDYAAPTGTPIKAAGNGHVIFVGNKGGYGKVVIIKHAYPYKTIYAHMSHFARNLRNGLSVKQGQVIGYVGNTGLSTGSHLHFEIRVNNIPHNPLTVTLPTGTRLAFPYREKFFTVKKEMLALMNMNQTALAAAHTTTTK